jgi:tetratricopeptide (TPR) repeat protein
MATSVSAGGRPAVTETRAASWLVQWAKAHKQWVAYGVVALAVVAGFFVWNLLSLRTAERNAGRELEQGRLALASANPNYQFAVSVLSKVVEQYAGTHAAEEASIVLAQAQLAQGKSQQAIDVLKQFAPEAGRDYQAQAYGLLAAAYENAARARDAADAYQHAADAAQYPFLRAQFLSDAGRAWLAAGDTAKALAAYRTVVEKMDSTSALTEVKVRIGELTKGADIQARP